MSFSRRSHQQGVEVGAGVGRGRGEVATIDLKQSPAIPPPRVFLHDGDGARGVTAGQDEEHGIYIFFRFPWFSHKTLRPRQTTVMGVQSVLCVHVCVFGQSILEFTLELVGPQYSSEDLPVHDPEGSSIRVTSC